MNEEPAGESDALENVTRAWQGSVEALMRYVERLYSCPIDGERVTVDDATARPLWAPEPTEPRKPPPSLVRPGPIPTRASPRAVAASTVVGSARSNIYHSPGCSSARRINASNLVTFGSRAEAEAAGRLWTSTKSIQRPREC